LALAVPLSRFTPRVGGGSAFFVRHRERMHQNSIGYKWEGAACLLSFMLAAVALYFGRAFLIAILASLVFSVVGTCFGFSYMRTWKPVYRKIVLAVLFVCAVAYYALIIFPF